MRFAVVCVSDRCSAGICEDRSGKLLAELVAPLSEETVYRLVPDEQAQIEAVLCELADREKADIILTTGGTGFAPRDVTPEATRDVCDREVPGIAEAMRAHSLAITPFAMLSRALCMQRERHIVINLPGSEKAARENWDGIVDALPHAAKMMAGGGH